ncbi:MAG: FAD-dependent oxidoreductase, partial [Candidatus Omnitrophica bacterium]|nr:FAD-dependent oxidoreductase [Candidatus Omnitrophota bacterium]
VECFDPASQLTMADLIENYPGLPEGIAGFSLIDKLKKQAKNFGLEFYSAKVDNVKLDDRESNIWQIKAGERVLRSFSIILAVGARPRKLGIKGEDEFSGKGVSYCAVCDGALFKGKDIVVAGGGNSAVSEALYLSRFAGKVILVHRRNRLRAVSLLAERAKNNQKIEFAWDSVITEIIGKDTVREVSLENTRDKSQSRLACSGVFISIGYVPNTGFLGDLIKLDDYGCIITDQEMQTSKTGIFACGDCRAKSLRQVVTAASDGAIAAFSASEYIDRLKGQSYGTE